MRQPAIYLPTWGLTVAVGTDGSLLSGALPADEDTETAVVMLVWLHADGFRSALDGSHLRAEAN